MADLTEHLATAEAKLNKLQRAHEDAEAERDRATKAYQAHRDPKLYTSQMAAEDIVADAAVALAAQFRVVERLRADRRTAEQYTLASALDAETTSIIDAFSAAGDQLVGAIRAWDAATDRLAAQFQPRALVQQQHGAILAPVSLERLVVDLNDRLAEVRGQYESQTTCGAVARLSDTTLFLEITRPCGHVPHGLR